MINLTSAAIADITELGAALVQCASVAEIQSRSMPFLCRLLDPSVIMFLRDPEQYNGTDRRLAVWGIDGHFEALYHSKFRENPYAEWARRMKGRWKAPVELPPADDQRILSSAFYRDFMRPLGMHHMLAIGLLKGGAYLGLVGLCRPEGHPEFGETDIAICKLIAPLLLGAMERALLQERLDDLEALADAAPAGGLAVLDQDMKVRYRNQMADDLLSQVEQGAIELRARRRHKLPASLHASCVAGAARLLHGQMAGLGAFDLPSGSSFSAALRFLSEANQNPRYLLMFASSTQAAPARDRLRVLGLTRREVDIVDAAVLGLTTNGIGSRLRISAYTVQTHLKTIYRKLDIHSRAELVGRVSLTH